MKEVEKVTESTPITITIHWFSVLAEKRGVRKETIQIPSMSTGEELIHIISSEFPSLNKYRQHIRLAVNKEYTGSDVQLQEGDEVAFITPVSGG